MRLMKLVLAFLLILLCASALAQQPVVYTMQIEGPIEPAVALYVHRSIQIAERNDAQALIVLIDTPGGLGDSMDSITKDFFASDVPIVVYVWPRGAKAASAGAIIALAANIAAMSPATNIGAAHPVAIGGEQPDQVMSKKLENDAAASARKIAKERGRNVQVAEDFVRKSVSLTQDEAKKQNVIDIIADDQKDLLQQINGRKVQTANRVVIINSRNADVRTIAPSLRERFLHVVGNPNVAYILMLIAIYGIIFELQNPGSVFPGVVGGIALILALFSFAVLPVNLAGVLLIVLGIALLVTDVFLPGHGILTVGGLIAFVIGSLILFETRSPVFRISVTLVITMAAVTGAFFLFAVGAGIGAQRAKVVTGKEGMIGQVAEARTDIAPKGKVFAEGSWWNAVTEGEPIKKGELVCITGMDKLLLRVKKQENPKA
ncbi:MAG TPA: nodulation protein NfeD [Armatimonadota bacterium]|nr:nodulation protein NfeD [Armatimonadota bacterium]